MAQGRTLQGAPEKLLQQALQADPNHIKALILLGSAKFERKDYAGAAALWRQIQSQVPPQSQLGQQIEQNVQEAIRLAQAAGTPVPAAIANLPNPANPANPASPATSSAPAAAADPAAASAPAGKVLLRGTVQLDPAVAKQVAAGDTVFIFARAPEGGPKFPLAVLKRQVQDLPLQFSFDDSNSMMPSSKLSDFKQVVVSARISKSGQPIASKGDWEGSIGPVNLEGAPVVIVINKQHP
jgi:cytochrome c-type biogenesis protein CcmH